MHTHKYTHRHFDEVVVSPIDKGEEIWIRINILYVAECSLNISGFLITSPAKKQSVEPENGFYMYVSFMSYPVLLLSQHFYSSKEKLIY